MNIVVGSSEHACIGFLLEDDELSPSFIESLTSPVTALASNKSCNGPLLVACASDDERIHLFDVGTKKTLGTLSAQSGTISDLSFRRQANAMYLFSSSHDGTVAIFECKSASGTKWSLLQTLTGKAPVLSLALHPSGKVMLTLCNDNTLHIWNLSNGSHMAKISLPCNGNQVRFSPDGSTFAVSAGNEVLIFDPATSDTKYSITCPSRVNTFSYVSPIIIVCGGDFSDLFLEDIDNKMRLATYSVGDNGTRTKWIDVQSSGPLVGTRIAVCTNQNIMSLLKFDASDPKPLGLVTSINTKCIPKFCVICDVS